MQRILKKALAVQYGMSLPLGRAVSDHTYFAILAKDYKRITATLALEERRNPGPAVQSALSRRRSAAQDSEQIQEL